MIRYDGARGVTWRIKYADSTGRQVMETVGRETDGISRRHAEAELRERLVRVERKQYRRPQPVTFRAFTTRWFEQGQQADGWKPATVTAYRRVLHYLNDHFGGTALASIRPKDVNAYTEKMMGTFSGKTVGMHLSVLHALMKDAVREELIERNPAEHAKRPKVVRRRWRILEPHEVPKVAHAFTVERARTVFLTLMLTGVRRHELLNLRWRDVNLVEQTIRVVESKTAEGERLIALSRALTDALVAHYTRSTYRADSDYVFAHPKRGSKMDPDWYAERFQAALTAANVEGKVRPFHDARHAALTNLAAAGTSPITLMGIAGHRSMSTTNQYVHLAGVVFPDAATALEDRLLGGRTFYPTEPTSADPAEPDRHESTPVA